MIGNSKFSKGNSSIEITGFSKSSVGRVFYKTPIKLVEGKPKRPLSFTTRFVFSISPEKGDGLAFVMVPLGYPLDLFDGGSFGMLNNSKFRTLIVEFDTKMNKKFGDLNANHVGINVNSFVSVKTTNVSKINLVLNSGEKLQAWIDYEASSKRVEIRLSKLGETKPIYPLLSCPIDLSHIWKDEEVLVGLSSSNGKSLQKCDLYSWEFKIRQIPRWMHSKPLDPEVVSKNTKPLEISKNRDCHLKLYGVFIFGVSCGALIALLLRFVWIVFVRKRPVVPEEFSSKSIEFEPEKLKVAVAKTVENGK